MILMILYKGQISGKIIINSIRDIVGLKMQKENKERDCIEPSVVGKIKINSTSQIEPVYEEELQRESWNGEVNQSFLRNLDQIDIIINQQSLISSIILPPKNELIVPFIDKNDMKISEVANKNKIGELDPKDKSIIQLENEIQQITLILIVASEQKIKQIQLGEKTKQSGKKLIGTAYQYKNFNIFISLFTINSEELKTHEIKYKEKTTKLLFFNSEMDKKICLHQIDRNNFAGILLNQTVSSQQNVELRNYCLLLANQIIAKNLKRLNARSRTLQTDFYKLMIEMFRVEFSQIRNIFEQFTICNTQSIYTEYFLYFFYHLFKNNSISLIKQYNLLKKLVFTQTSCKDVIKINKYYNAFECRNELKLFYLQIFLLYSLQYWKQEDAATVLKFNLQYQDKSKSKEIMNVIMQKKSKIIQYLDTSLNILLITNKNISFNQYLQIKIKYLQLTYQECSKNKKLQKFNEEALTTLTYLLEKARKNNIVEERNLNQNLLEQLAYVLGKIRMTESHIGLFYTQWKCLFSTIPQLKQPIYKIIWPLINEKIPLLMSSNIMEIIYPLIIKPQIPEQIILLLNYFQKQQLTFEILQFLITLLIQPHHTLYNYRTINNLLINSLAHNKSIAKINLIGLTDLLSKQLNKQQTSKDMRQQILLLCKQIINEMQPHQNSQHIIEWYKNITSQIQ